MSPPISWVFSSKRCVISSCQQGFTKTKHDGQTIYNFSLIEIMMLPFCPIAQWDLLSVKWTGRICPLLLILVQMGRGPLMEHSLETWYHLRRASAATKMNHVSFEPSLSEQLSRYRSSDSLVPARCSAGFLISTYLRPYAATATAQRRHQFPPFMPDKRDKKKKKRE